MKTLPAALLASLLGVTLHAQVSRSATLYVSSSATVNFGNASVLAGSPDIFGMNGYPSTISRQLDGIGVTLIRLDYISGANARGATPTIPNTTIAAYNAALADGCTAGSVCDPSTWDWADNTDITQLTAARASGHRLLTLLSPWTNPAWNSWSGALAGVPEDWGIYEDIVKKVYQHLRGDLVEIWNEPGIPSFLILAGSPYSSGPSAYADIYYHTAHAIRIGAGDATVQLGGPVESDFAYTAAMFAAPLIPTSWINFASIHSYGEYDDSETIYGANYRAEVNTHRPGFPIYLTEWNMEPDAVPACGDLEAANGPTTVALTGLRLINMLSNSTALYTGANFFKAASGPGPNGCIFADQNNILLPKSRTWRLMSHDLGLGAGAFSVYSSTTSGGVKAMGAVNSSGQHVTVLVNNSRSPIRVNLVMSNTGLSGIVTLREYLADFNANTASAPVFTGTQAVGANSSVNIPVNMTAYSIGGVSIN